MRINEREPRGRQMESFGASSRAGLGAIMFVSTILCAVSAWAGWQEASPFLLRAASLEVRVASVVEANSANAPVRWWESRIARRARIETCLDTLREARGIVQSTAALVRELENGCLAIVISALSRAPNSANEWFLAAAMARRQEDLEMTRKYLDMSYRAGPTEQWIAARRAVFAYNILDELTPSLRSRMDADFVLLLRTRNGIQQLARLYVEDRTLREHLVRLAETLEPPLQRQFIEHVEGVVKG
jgi:hypothetical protein